MCTPGRPPVGAQPSAGRSASPRPAPARPRWTASRARLAVDQRRSTSPANSSCVYGQSSSTAACIRRCDSSVPSPSRTVHSDAWSRWYARLLARLGARSRRAARRRRPASALVERQLVRRQEQQLRHRRRAKSPLGSSTSRQLRNSRSSRRYASASSSRPAPSSSPAYVSSSRATPSWSSAMLASATSSSISGARAHHSAEPLGGDRARRRRAAARTRPASRRLIGAAPLRHLVEGRVPVDLVGGRVEERVLLVRAGRGDRGGRHHPDRHALLPAGVDVAGVAQRHLRVGRVQAADVACATARAGAGRTPPTAASSAHCRLTAATLAWRCLAAYAAAASRTQAPSSWARRRCAIRCRLHGPSPLITRISSS